MSAMPRGDDVPPSYATEQAVLGALLLDNGAFAAAQPLTAAHFRDAEMRRSSAPSLH